MTNLDLLRKKINKSDKKIAKSFEKRMEAVKLIASYKKEKNLPIEDLEREKVLLENNLKYIEDENLKEYYKKLFEKLLELSKDYQK